MPIYEYLCESCGPFEQVRDYNESSALMLCPSCHEIAKRVYSAPSLIIDAVARRRREQRTEPRLVTLSRSETPSPPKWKQSTGRPWQLGH